jgi:transposase
MRQEVLSGVERRRRWSDAEKLRIVMEAAADGALVADVARRHDITRQHIYQWRRELRDKAQPSIEQSNFVAVELTGSDERHDMITPAVDPVATGAHHLEIMLRNGRSLRITADVPDQVLHRLMRVVERS